MYTLEKQEQKFKQDLNDFEAMLNNDLNTRVSETTQKFSFDFFAEAPLKDAQGPFTWTKNDAPLLVRKEPICRLTPKKRISIDAFMSEKKEGDGRFSLIAGRNSIFSSQAPTESTACESRIEGMDSSIPSMVSGTAGFSFDSGVDLNGSMNFDMMRPTVGLNTKFERRSTLPYGATIPEDSRESCESINNRASELEGTINTPQAQVTNIKSASKTGSVSSYRNTSPIREGQSSNRSGGSGQKRELIGRAKTEQFQMEESKSPSNPFTPQ